MARHQASELNVLVGAPGGCLHPDTRTGRSNFVIRLPWYETLVMGNGANNTIGAGSSVYRYSSGSNDAIEIWGITVNLVAVNSDFRGTFLDISDQNIMVPFFQAPLSSFAGIISQAEPILYFSEPYTLRPGAELEVRLQNTNQTISYDNVFITLVGVRLLSVCANASASSI